MVGAQAADVGLDQGGRELLLARREGIEPYAFASQVIVVAEGADDDLTRHVAHEDGLASLGVVERLDQLQRAVLLLVEDPGTGVLAGRGDDRLRTKELRRHDDLIAHDEAVDDQMMAVDLPAPGLRVGRQRDPPGTTIGMSTIKQVRLSRSLTSHPGLHVGQCVPFYFCPRSVMLYMIFMANHPDLGYRGG